MISRQALQLIVAFMKRTTMKGEETEAYNLVMGELANEFRAQDAADKDAKKDKK